MDGLLVFQAGRGVVSPPYAPKGTQGRYAPSQGADGPSDVYLTYENPQRGDQRVAPAAPNAPQPEAVRPEARNWSLSPQRTAALTHD